MLYHHESSQILVCDDGVHHMKVTLSLR